MGIALGIILALFVFPYIAGPLLLWFSGSRIPPTQLDEADPSIALPQSAESHFWKTTHFFSANGFEQIGARVRESARNGLSSFKQLWRHAETGEVALVGAFHKEDDPSFANTFVAFMHDRSGAMVTTSNFNAGARTLLDPPFTSRVTVPTQDVSELRALHRGHVAVYGPNIARPLRVRDCMTLCKQLEEATRAVALSQKRFRVEGDSLRVTFYGAIFGIWINLWPFKSKYERREKIMLERVMAAGVASGALTAGRRAA
ncbi:MAG TPA: hypothetical protein VH762_06930 [Gemmatimonadaceae bacterium]|jgi:hypothetical protein